MKKFSVSMCVYGKDNPEWFKVAVKSILEQTVVPSEIVIVVDGPVPEELNFVISEFSKNPLFKIIYLESNQGHGKARRIGLNSCSYDLVALMDADDISIPTRFELQLKEFDSDSELSIVGGQIIEFIDNSNNLVSARIVPCKDFEIKKFMKKRCPMNQPTVMFKKKDVFEVGGYQDWYCNEDYYLWFRMAISNKKMANVKSTLVYMRTNSNSFRRRGGLKYFKSELLFQKMMLSKHYINVITFTFNVLKRFLVEVMLPNSLRGFVYKIFARKRGPSYGLYKI